nr:hypothetical protein [Tanacetum cinerariifolium]
MTNYSLWEVIKNGNKVLKKTIGTVEQIYEPTSVEEKLNRKNEIKARGTLLMALPNKDQLKFHSYQDAKLLMEAIKKRHGGNKESKKVQRTLLKQQYKNFAASSSETLDQTFDRLQKLINKTAYGVSTAHTQGNTVNSTSVEQIDPDDLKEMDLHWEMAMLTIKARRLIKRTCRNLDINGQKIGFDRGREYGRKIMPVENPIENALIAQDGIGGYNWSYQAREEHPINYALMVLTLSGRSSSLDSKENVKSRSDKGYHVVPSPYTGNYIPPKPDLIFIDEQVECEYADVVSTISSSAVKTVESKFKSIDVKNKGVPISNAFKRGYSQAIRLFNKYSAYKKTTFNKEVNAVKASACWGNPQQKEYKEKRVINSGCSRHMTRNKCYLTDYKDYDGGFVSFGDGKGRISRKDKINILNLEVKLRDNALVEYTKKLEKVEKERDELKLTLKKYQNSSKSLNTLLGSQVSDKVKTGPGYKVASPAEESFVKSSKMLENQENVKSRLDKGYHAVPSPYPWNYIPPKPNLMFIDKQVKSESMDVVSNVSSSAVKTIESKVELVDVKK